MSHQTTTTCDHCGADITDKFDWYSVNGKVEAFDFCDLVCLAGYLEMNAPWARKTYERRKVDQSDRVTLDAFRVKKH